MHAATPALDEIVAGGRHRMAGVIVRGSAVLTLSHVAEKLPGAMSGGVR